MSSGRFAAALASAVLAATSGAAASPRWVEVRTPHFTVLSDAGENMAAHAAQQFERFRAALSGTLPWARRLDPGVPILIFLARNEATFRALLPEFWERKDGVRPTGVFRRSARRYYIVVQTEAMLPREPGATPYSVLYHEYAHLVVDLNLESIPLWLNEGVAELLGGTIVEKDRIELGWPIPSHLQLLRSRAPLPVAELFKIDEDSPEYNERDRSSIFYAQSWALVHCLVMGQAANRIGQFIALRQAQTAEAEAAARAFGDTAALDRSLEACLGKGFASGHRNTGRMVERPSSWRAVPSAEIAAVQGLFLADAGRPEARPFLEEALRLDPQQPGAREGLGTLAWKDGREDEARRWLAEAVALPSASAAAHYLNAVLALRGGRDEKSRKEARLSLERSVALDSGFAASHALLAEVSVFSGDEPERGQEHIRRAIELEPSVFDHRLAAARLLLLCGRIEEARNLGGQLVAHSRLESQRSAARAFLATLLSPAGGLARDLPALVAILERRCAWGEARDCLELGDRFRQGVGVAPDAAKAAAGYGQACQGGAFEACGRLGWLADQAAATPEDGHRAKAHYEQGCEGGDLFSCARLGWLLGEGKRVPRDASRGLALCTKACEGGHAAGCSLLGILNMQRGDYVNAAPALARACEGGDAAGCANLALSHERGLGVAKSVRRAMDLLRAACDKGLTSSCDRLKALSR